MFFRIALSLLPLCAPCLAAPTWRTTSPMEKVSLSHGATYYRVHLAHPEKTFPIDIHLVTFHESQCTLRVIDQAKREGENFLRLGAAMEKHRALAGVNASFFHPNFTPLGLVISGGKTIHRQEKARLLSGILCVDETRIHLMRAKQFTLNSNVREAVQAGPFLLENGKALPGLSRERPAPRSFVATDGRGTWVIGRCGSLTLYELSQLLAENNIFPDLNLTEALNLDGGTSSGLWAQLPDRTLYLRELVRVRNYLAIVPLTHSTPPEGAPSAIDR